MRLKKYTLEQLKNAVKTSYSYRQTLQKLSVAAYGGNYEVLKKAIRHFSLDSSHFRGQGWNKGMKFPSKQPLEYYFAQKHRLNTYKFKKRLIKEKILYPICSNCGLETWLNGSIPLELDHIDGDSHNNELKNLRLLCPNCHALTDTYRGKNILKV